MRKRSLPRRALLAVLWLGTLGLPAALPAQTAPLADLLRRVFASAEFAPRQRFGPARWIEQGAAYTTLERSAEVPASRDIVRYDAATGARTILISASRLVPSGAAKPLDIEDYSWSADGGRLLIFTNTERVWRQNTRGDYWVLERGSGALRKLGGRDAPESSLMYAKFSPRGDRVGYVRQGELYVENLADGRITRLTTGADSLHVNGMSDWVYEEEFDLRDGFRWSPDGTRLAYWQFDMTGVGTFRLINDTDSLYPKIVPIQYPKAGTTNSAVRVGVVQADGGATRWIELGDDLRENYLPRMEWASASELVLQRMNRLQNSNRVLLADAATGAVRTILTERDSAWVDVVDDLVWLGKGAEFLWPSERDGWRHVYRVSRDGAKLTLVTPGAFDVVSIAGVDESGGWLYYIASPENATQRYLFRTRLDGKGGSQRLSPADAPGTHRYQVSPGAQWAFHSYSRFDRPAVTELVRLPSHQVARSLVNDSAQRAAVAKLIARPTEFFKVPVGDG
ncbi:MAG TPA: DPP IV N-terminal domain-containing protein, partial [Gemmatimonadales bacterium]|nr:DPP IV N-terminal domain-containing protein [Gemmatimonadales bacterium]